LNAAAGVHLRAAFVAVADVQRWDLAHVVLRGREIIRSG
jgi:hypothetical protein